MNDLNEGVTDWRDFDFRSWFENLSDAQRFPALLREYERYVDLANVFEVSEDGKEMSLDALHKISAELMLVQTELLQIAVNASARSVDDIIVKLRIWQLGSSVHINRIARVAEGRLVLSALGDLKRLRAEMKLSDGHAAAVIGQWFGTSPVAVQSQPPRPAEGDTQSDEQKR